jgi:hypothetical protein
MWATAEDNVRGIYFYILVLVGGGQRMLLIDHNFWTSDLYEPHFSVNTTHINS